MSSNSTPEAKQDEVRRLAAEGLSLSEIARRTGLYRSTVRKYAKEPPRPPVDPVAARRQKAESEAKRKEFVASVNEQAFRDTLRELVEANAAAIEPPPRYKPRKPPKGVVTESLLPEPLRLAFLRVGPPRSDLRPERVRRADDRAAGPADRRLDVGDQGAA
jgi:predicted transcriptional regulator